MRRGWEIWTVELWTAELWTIELWIIELRTVELWTMELWIVELWTVDLCTVEVWTVERTRCNKLCASNSYQRRNEARDISIKRRQMQLMYNPGFNSSNVGKLVCEKNSWSQIK